MQQNLLQTDNYAPLQLRLPPEMRKAAFWAALGILVCGPVLTYTSDPEFEKPFLVAARQALPWSLLLGYLLVKWADHFRIVVDATGVHRRILFRWQHWPWVLFESGTTRLSYRKGSFIFPDQPWYRRDLNVGGYPEQDAELAVNICMSHWVRPEPEALPVQVKVHMTNLTVLRLSCDKIIISRFGRSRTYRWDDVQNAVLYRSTAEHNDFYLLKCEIGGRRFDLAQQSGNNTFLGTEPKQIAALFEACLPPDRLIIRTSDTPRTLKEAEQQLAEFREAVRKWRRSGQLAFLAVPIFLLGKIAFVFLKGGKLSIDVHGAVIIGLMMLGALLYLCVPLVCAAEDRKSELELIKKRDELAAAESGEAETGERSGS